MSKLITVFGATGNQGGSVVKAILGDEKLSSEYKIRGVTRDTSKPAAQALAKQGVELVTADLNSKDSIAAAIKGSDSVFLVTNYWETRKAEDEIRQGKNVADVAKETGIKQLIFSCLINVTETTGGRLSHVAHFDSKAGVAKYIKETGIGCAFPMPGYFMSNLVEMLRKGDDGSYTLTWPVSHEAKFPLLDIADDYGKFALPALRDPEKYNGKHLFAAQDYYTPQQIVSQFTEVTGKKAKYVQVSNEEYMGFLPDFMAEEMLENHLLIDEPGYYGGENLKESLDAIPEKLKTWKEFVAEVPEFK